MKGGHSLRDSRRQFHTRHILFPISNYRSTDNEVHSREQQGLSSGHWLLESQDWAQAVDAKSDAKRIDEPRRTMLKEGICTAIELNQKYIYTWETKDGRERLQYCPNEKRLRKREGMSDTARGQCCYIF